MEKDISNRLKVAELAIGYALRLLQIEGPITVRDGQMFAGSTLLNGDERIVDAVKAKTRFGCTVFLGNERIATVASERGKTERALGTRANDEVTRLVFEEGGTFRGKTKTLGRWWAIVYVPLHDANGVRVGMLAAYRELRWVES